MTFYALLDACVLFPMYLRDSLLRLAAADLYRPVWSSKFSPSSEGRSSGSRRPQQSKPIGSSSCGPTFRAPRLRTRAAHFGHELPRAGQADSPTR